MFYGGKGGVGKTTCAAARALAEARLHRRVLVVSTDPAHSLGDAFDKKLSTRPVRVTAGLDAVELDAPRAFRRWLTRHRAALADIVEHGTWLDRNDADSLLDLTIPGVDELIGILEIARLSESGYDGVVVDTAPTGHTLRLIAAPDTVAAVADVLDALQEEHRLIRDQLARVGRAEAADDLIAMIARQASGAAASLRDPRATTFTWVTLPERLSIAESEDGIAALTRQGVDVPELVVNRLMLQVDACQVCEIRRDEEHRMLTAIRASLAKGRRMRIVPALLEEPRGVSALRAIGGYLTGECTLPTVRTRRPGSRRQPAPVVFSTTGGATRAVEAIPAVRDARLIFVGGKGGVGKTTVAAALALRLAAARPAASIYLLSTDPAHSLSDVFSAGIGDEPTRIPDAPPNLIARELDAARAFRGKRVAFEDALAEVAPASGGAQLLSAGSARRHDATARLFDLAPPGIDELFALLSVTDARAAHDVIVVDTAPTGHTLRLLALPGVARAWVQALLRLLLKYRDVVRPGQLAQELVSASQSIRQLQDALRDSARTRFIVVTRAARVPRTQTGRLLAQLRALGIAPGAVIVNARTMARGTCRRCRIAARAERREMALLRPPRGCAIIQTPLAVPPPRGAVVLKRWAQTWMADV